MKKSKGIKDDTFRLLSTVGLAFIDPGVSPFDGYRWRDVAGYLYSDGYRTSYGYDDEDVQVQVTFEYSDLRFQGHLSATHLKPNFAYQLKINGRSEDPSNELIGLAGRWWQEEWDGSQWSNGQNLNNKGDGTSPNPNDLVYFARRDVEDATSPTGRHYRYTGYLVCDYFITDENGDAELDFEANSSYHVLWNSEQRNRTGDDGPEKSATFDPDPTQPAYDSDYPDSTVIIFGEWERLPVGEITLAPGAYECQIIITEESFHGWPGGDYTGNWAAAMGADIIFAIEDNPLNVQLSSFSAESIHSCVLIRWVTESELNHAGFELLKSEDQTEGYVTVSDFHSNTDLMGQGNSSVEREYSYIDRNVLPGRSYWYSLVDVTLSGQRSYHGPVSVYVTDNSGLKYLSAAIPQELLLYPNFPNPFNAMTRVRFAVPSTDGGENTIGLAIYNSRGQRVRALYQGHLSAGYFEITWDGKSDGGMWVSSGVYFVVLRSQIGKKTGKIILLK